MIFDILSIIYLVIFIAFLAIGYISGVFKTLVKILKSFVSTILSTFLTIPLSKLIISSNWGASMIARNTEMLTAKGGIFIQPYNVETQDEIFDSLHLAEILRKPFIRMIDKLVPTSSTDITVAEAVAPVIVHYAVVGICFIIFFILLRLLCLFLNEWIERNLGNHPFLSTVDKVLGLVLYGTVGLLLVFLISYGISFIIPLDNSFSRWLVTQLHLEDDVFTLSKFVYNHNFIVPIFAWFSRA